MGTPSVDGVFRVPGRLYVGPSAFDSVAHYGTCLGVIAEAVVIPTFTYTPIIGEEFGGETIEWVKQGEAWVFGATLREWSQDVISNYFPTATGGGAGNKIVTGEATSRPGAKVSSVALLFVPNEPTTHPSFYAKRAVPLIRDTVELNFRLGEELTVGVIFSCIRSASGTPVQIGTLSELTV
jgi:hypothetical protein